MPDAKIEALVKASEFLNIDDLNSAKKVIEEKYPFIPIKHDSRKYTIKQMMEQFFKDGFIDRYSGNKLVNPGMLRVISQLLPDSFPYQSHWKTDECHISYWDYQPTLDHIYPIALGGKDSEENWATTSMVNNSAKSNFTLEQLGWTLKEQGDIKDWDGLSKIFIEIVEKDFELLKISRIKDYYIATKSIIEKYEL